MPPPPTPLSAPLAAIARRPMVAAVWAFILLWIARHWLDALCMAVLAAVSLAVYFVPVPVTRTFPITFDVSGDIIYPEWAYPNRGWIIPSWLSGLVSIGVPIVVYLAAQLRIKSAWDASCAIMGTAWAVLLGTLYQVVLKMLIGGFRPYFLAVCMPDISRAATHNATGLNGVGFHRIMYTTEICTQPDAFTLKTAITSFPSGHSTTAFAGFGFLFLWMNAKLKVWADHSPAFWKLFLTMAPMLVATFIAASLTIDAAHNWYDIVGGSAIGIVTALAAYRASYAAVWDWRFNHLALDRNLAFVYAADGQVSGLAAHTLTKAAGRGQDATPHALPQQLQQVDSASSSAALARQPAEMHGAGEGLGAAHGQEQQGMPTRRVVPEGEAV